MQRRPRRSALPGPSGVSDVRGRDFRARRAPARGGHAPHLRTRVSPRLLEALPSSSRGVSAQPKGCAYCLLPLRRRPASSSRERHRVGAAWLFASHRSAGCCRPPARLAALSARPPARVPRTRRTDHRGPARGAVLGRPRRTHRAPRKSQQPYEESWGAPARAWHLRGRMTGWKLAWHHSRTPPLSAFFKGALNGWMAARREGGWVAACNSVAGAREGLNRHRPSHPNQRARA